MKALKFNLSGQTAFFKKPDVNSYIYFTYSNIHKVSLLGILGAILGLEGYNQQKRKINPSIYPEFYENLKDLKISIVPKNISLTKKIQVFNNSVGYASFEEGGNLIIKEQWLENPEWDIYILLDNGSGLLKTLEERLLKYHFTYIPYLGKNDHIANVKDVEILDIENIEDTYEIHSLIDKASIETISQPQRVRGEYFKYEERLPYKLEKITNQYIYQKFLHTNFNLKLQCFKDIYRCNDLNLFFF
ncbi:type I-B CRISPR-associated protein Cas5b [Cetobacterium somerae]|uniref:type I-B CRISPR-associated protein Cas5b n=1 Tax=Cetobacterium sp. NK01 TaxID=2993530 RepID=UPI002116DF2F|nr:type I-B CRISPR-associated protein Cas5b [Cetobacterium sp. NK01]MCQ8213452.1 type I-B CRISPR-associated protein Cas5b [Cetobacterium sp. NK01]